MADAAGPIDDNVLTDVRCSPNHGASIDIASAPIAVEDATIAVGSISADAIAKPRALASRVASSRSEGVNNGTMHGIRNNAASRLAESRTTEASSRYCGPATFFTAPAIVVPRRRQLSSTSTAKENQRHKARPNAPLSSERLPASAAHQCGN